MYQSFIRIKCKVKTKAPRHKSRRNSEFCKSGPNCYPNFSIYTEPIATVFVYINSLGLFTIRSFPTAPIKTLFCPFALLFFASFHSPHHPSCD